jgi:arylsulfatase A
MRRRAFLSSSLGVGLTSLCRPAPAAARPPNIVVVLCDDLGYGDMSCYGHPVIRTPNFDRFAAEGVRLTDCYAASPVCSPSRAGLLTGRVPDRAGIFNWVPMEPCAMHLRREEISFPRLLRDAGYHTCLSGKWHLNGVLGRDNPQAQPGDHGFEHWFATGAWATPSQHNPDNFYRNGAACGPIRGYSSTIIVDEATNWLDRVGTSAPFCLQVAFHAPHEPIASDAKFVRSYSKHPHKRGEDLYWANVTELDAEFGRLLAYLDRHGLRENTLVVFTSDNGPETLNRHPDAWRSYGSAGPLRSRKLSLYEGGYRVPGALRWPGRIPAGAVSREPVSSVDLLPTFCELAGVPLPNRRLDGASLVPLFDGRPVRRQTPLHWHYYNALDRPVAALREGDWKVLGIPARPCPREPGGFIGQEDLDYIFGAQLTGFELYNLAADPGEKLNLARREPLRLRRMADDLARLQREVLAEAPRWDLRSTGPRVAVSRRLRQLWQ